MRRGGRILVLLGIILGIMTAVLVFFYLATNTGSTTPPPTHPVVIAQQNIEARSLIASEFLNVIQLPDGIDLQGSFSSTDRVAGKLARDKIYQGSIILAPMVIDRSTFSETNRSPASYVIPDNKVAIAFNITPLTGIAGAIQPGDYVDMLLTLTPGPTITTTTGTRPSNAQVTGTEGEAVTQLFLQDVQVLNIGIWSAPTAQGQAQAQGAAIITLVVERQDALALKSARELGQIDLVLRKAGDHKQFTPTSIEPVTREYINRRFNFKLLPAIR